MEIISTPLPGLMIIEPKVFEDQRGYFFESYNEQRMKEQGIDIRWVQDNQSKSGFGVLRGLHYQLDPWAQTKLVRVLEGEILDVAVDLRKGSPTYKKWYGIRLSGENKKQLLVPAGFAHGFSVLSETATVFYKCDQFYNPSCERGILYDDCELGIDWGLQPGTELLSPKDRVLPLMKNAENTFRYQDV
jgi:dTDP-4-dehydrorhamnose 3,5-epimerase